MGSRLLRAVAAGSSVVLGKEMIRHGGVQGFTRSVSWVVRDMNKQQGSDLPVPGSTGEALLTAVAAGGTGGAGYVPFSWPAPSRGAVRGAAYGATVWAVVEVVFRASAQRDREWLADPKLQLPALMAFGSLVGWLVDR